MTIILLVIAIVAIVLSVLFFFLHKRVEDMASKLMIVYDNIDLLHKNQEELLAQNLKMFHDSKKEKN